MAGVGLLRRAAPFLFFACVVVLWELAVRGSALPAWLLPSPSEILFQSYRFRLEFPRHLLATLLATILGFTAAAVIGIGLALLFASVRFLEQTIYPALVAIQSVPKVALAPLFLMWIGYGIATKVAIVFLVAIFPIVVTTTTGLKAAPDSLIQMVRAFKASPITELFQIRLPYAIPYVFVGLRVGITLATTGAVIGEFVGASEGLGYLISVATQQFNTSLAFGSIVLLALLSIGLYYLVDIAQRILFPWSMRDQQSGRGIV
jgi:NitT/TauT family transport system permease protein